MIKTILKKSNLLACAAGILISLLGKSATATIIWWDPNGTTSVGGNGTWTAGGLLWSSTSAQSASLIAWNTADAAGFCAGPGSSSQQGVFFVTNNTANLGFAGIFNGSQNPGPCDVTILGTGSLSLAGGAQAFSTFNSSLGFTRIKVPINGTGQVVAESTGQLFLEGVNTYSGGTVLGFSGASFSGIVNFNNASSFGSGGITLQTLGNSGALVLEGSSAVTIPNSVTVSSLTTNNIVGNTAGLKFSGPWTLSSNVQIGSGGGVNNVVEISGAISGAFSLGKMLQTPSGILKLSGANTYTGATTNLSGTLMISGAGRLNGGNYTAAVNNQGVFDYASSANQILGGVISGAGSIIVDGPGTLTNSGVNTYTGTNLLNGGVLTVAADTGLGAAPGAATAASVTINGGTLRCTGSAAITFPSANRGITIGANGGTIDIPNAAGTMLASGGQPIIGAGNNVTKTGAGTYRAPAASTFSKLIVNGGLWQGGADTVFGAVPGSATADAITLNGGGISANSGYSLSATRGITIGASGGRIDCSSSLTVPGPIIGTGDLTKSGALVLTLSGANTYSGKTSITNGGLSVSSYNSVASPLASSSLGAPTTVANGTISIGFGTANCTNIYTGPGEVTDRVLDFSGTTGGATLQADGAGPIEFTSNPTFSGSGPKTITLAGLGSGVIDGLIADSAGGITAISKVGAGKWTLNGNNIYSGATTLNTAGQLNFGSQFAIGSGIFAIGGNGFFDNTSGADLTVTNAFALSGGSPTYVGSANNMTFTGPVSISGATGRTITVNANTVTIAQGITQGTSGMNFTKAGAGTLKLQGANAWSGNTTISGGTLALDGSATLASTALTIGSSGTLDVSTLSSSLYTPGVPITATGTATGAATIKGSSGGNVDFGTKNISLTFAPTTFNGDLTHPALTITGGSVLQLGGNAYTVNNNGGTALGLGTYTLITTPGIAVTGSSTVSVTGSGLAAGTVASIAVNSTEVDLVVNAIASFSGLTASQSITYGTPSVTLSGVVSGAGPTVAADGETVAVTINGNTQNATIAGGAGAFSVVFPTATIPFSPSLTIAYTYAGDASLTSASDTSTALTVNKAALTVTANDQSKVYGQTIATGPGNTNFTSSALQNTETIGSVTLAVSSGGDGANSAVAGSPYTITSSAATGGTFNPNNYNISYVAGNLTVTAASLTVTANGTLTYGEDPSNAVYVASYSPLQGTDDVSVVTGAGNYSTDATATNYVGTNYIAHIVDLGTLSSPNYTLVAGLDGVLTITNRPLYVTNVTASDKIYDATTAATADVSGAGLTNFVNGDDASVSLVTLGALAAFDDKNTGSNKTVTVTGLTTAGDLGTNYFIAPALATASIGQYVTNVVLSAGDRVYDTTTNEGVSVLIAPLGSDAVSAGASSTGFADKNVGTGKTVYVSGIMLFGADAGNYLVPTSGTTTASITPSLLGISAIGINKVYDGTTSASATLVDNHYFGDDITDSYTNALFSDKTVGTGKPVTVSGISFSGADAGNYTMTSETTVSVTADITARALTVSATGINKVYDGTTAASVNLSDDKVLGDDVSDSYTSAAFADKNVNTGIAVSVTGISISGDDTGNYSLVNSAASTTANIMSTGLTVSGVVAPDKVYDGTTNASVILTNAALVGVAGGDDVTLVTSNAVAAFADKNVGSNKLVTVTAISIVGADAGNYSFASSLTTNASITPATLTVSAAGVNKVYDSTTVATVNLSDDKIAGDAVTDAYTSEAFADKNVNTGIAVSVTGISISGADAGNYTLASTTASTTADITLRSLTVAAGGVNKAYDGMTTATVTLSDDKVFGDAVTDAYTSAAFADKNVNTGIAVSVSGISISGADSANYSLVNTSAATVADIIARTLTVSAVAANKVYDGTTTASVTLSDDKVPGDDVSETNSAANFADANVGTGKSVTVSGIGISGGADANNYSLVSSTATTTADITALASSAAIISSLNPSAETSNVTFTATISAGVGTPAGDVVFLANGTPFSTNSLVSGVAAASSASLPVGTNTVAVQYAAQSNYLSSSASLDQVVNSGVTLSVTNIILSIVNNGDGTYDLDVLGTPSAVYYLETTSDLTPPISWTIVPGSTNTASSGDGTWSATVSTAPPSYFRSKAVNPAP